MEEISIIQDFCADILCCPLISEDMMNNLALSAVLMEDEINSTDGDVMQMTSKELADYISKYIPVCSVRVADEVYFLLIQMAVVLPN